MPRIRTWPLEEEEELKLTPVELEAFGDSSKQKGSPYPQQKGPCYPVPSIAGVRSLQHAHAAVGEKGLSESRLREKGLYGVLVESTALKVLRHLHPQEAAAMCGLDPTLHWGREARMALGAVGQLASPVQAVWLFSHILRKLQVVQWQMTTVDPKLMLMAYRAWLLAKCKVLLYDYTQFPVTETLGKFQQVWAISCHAHQKVVGLLCRFKSWRDNSTSVGKPWKDCTVHYNLHSGNACRHRGS